MDGGRLTSLRSSPFVFIHPLFDRLTEKTHQGAVERHLLDLIQGAEPKGMDESIQYAGRVCNCEK